MIERRPSVDQPRAERELLIWFRRPGVRSSWSPKGNDDQTIYAWRLADANACRFALGCASPGRPALDARATRHRADLLAEVFEHRVSDGLCHLQSSEASRHIDDKEVGRRPECERGPTVIAVPAVLEGRPRDLAEA